MNLSDAVSIQEYLAHALSYAAEGVFLVDNDNRVLYCNAPLEKLIGMNREQVVGRDFRPLFTQLFDLSGDPERARQDLDLALQNLEQRPLIYVTIPHPLAERLQISLFPIGDELAASDGWGGVVRAVTGEWGEIVQPIPHVAVLVSELRESFAEVSGLASTLFNGHQRWEAEERQHFIASLVQAIEQLTKLFENEQELLKFQTGKLKLERRPTSVRPLINQAVQQLSHELALKVGSHPFNIDVPYDLPQIEIDPQKVEHLLVTVLGYVVNRASPGNTLRIAAQQGLHEVSISVASQLDALPANRLTGDVLKEAQGTPTFDARLPRELYVAAYLALAHGGRFYTDSTNPQQTSIHCVFPITAHPANAILPDQPQLRLVSPQAATQRESKSHLAYVRALVVDDDPQIAQYLKTVLEENGYYVVTAESGKQALEVASLKRPNFVLLDMRLPDIDGLAVCTQLRESLSVPIIMVTADTDPEATIRALDVGADDYVTKPINARELLARIRASLRRVSNPEYIPNEAPIRIGNLLLDSGQHLVRIGEKTPRLTPTEFKLLYFLARNAGQILTHNQILSGVWGDEYADGIENLWVHINHLRKKIEPNPANPQYVLTEPGVGYYMPAPTKAFMLREG